VPIKGIILFAALVGSLPACFVRPFYGILIWTIIAFANPQSALFYWSAANSFPWAVAVAVPTLIGFVVFSPKWGNFASGKVLLLLVLWSWFTFTTILSMHTPVFMHHADDTWYHWGFVSKIIFMTAITIAIIDNFDRLRIMTLTIAGCFGYFVLKAFPFLILTGGAFRLYGPEYSMIADNNDFGLALNMTLPFYFCLAQTEENKWVRRFFGALFVMTVPAVFFTYSRGALVGMITVTTLMLLRSRHRLYVIPVIGFGVGVALLFAPPAWKNRMDPTRPDAIDGSAKSRLNAWAYSWNLAQDYPLAGGGFGTFTPQLFDVYAPNIADIHGPHSIYFQVLAEHGFIGLALYLILILSCFISVFRLIRWAKFHGDSLVLTYANMFRFSLIGFLTSGIFLGRAYFDYFFTIVACLAALERIARERWANLEQEEEENESVEFGQTAYLPEGEAAI